MNVYIEYLIYQAMFDLVFTQMMSKLSLNIEIPPQMCYNTLKKGQIFHSSGRGVSTYPYFILLFFALSVGGEGGQVNDTIFTLFAAFLF